MQNLWCSLEINRRRRYILGYWFADHENEIYCAIQKAGFSSPIKSQNNEIAKIYQIIRTEQDKENWTIRRRLHFLLIMKKRWKELTEGWYVLKPGYDHPMALTCIQKNGIPYGLSI